METVFYGQTKRHVALLVEIEKENEEKEKMGSGIGRLLEKL